MNGTISDAQVTVEDYGSDDGTWRWAVSFACTSTEGGSLTGAPFTVELVDEQGQRADAAGVDVDIADLGQGSFSADGVGSKQVRGGEYRWYARLEQAGTRLIDTEGTVYIHVPDDVTPA